MQCKRSKYDRANKKSESGMIRTLSVDMSVAEGGCNPVLGWIDGDIAIAGSRSVSSERLSGPTSRWVIQVSPSVPAPASTDESSSTEAGVCTWARTSFPPTARQSGVLGNLRQSCAGMLAILRNGARKLCILLQIQYLLSSPLEHFKNYELMAPSSYPIRGNHALAPVLHEQCANTNREKPTCSDGIARCVGPIAFRRADEEDLLR
jgi:hypothetical protein